MDRILWLFGARPAPEKIVVLHAADNDIKLRRLRITRANLVRARETIKTRIQQAARANDVPLAKCLAEEYEAKEIAIRDCDIETTTIHRTSASVSGASTNVNTLNTHQAAAANVQRISKSVARNRLHAIVDEAEANVDRRDDIASASADLYDAIRPEPTTPVKNDDDSDYTDDDDVATATHPADAIFKKFAVPHLPPVSRTKYTVDTTHFPATPTNIPS